MEKFTNVTATAAPLALPNIDTDMIIPKQFLKTIKRTGLSEGLFFEMRYDVDGNKIEDFILHKEPYDKAEVLIALDNFGCGSSREHAPWALLDFGIKCVIAPSFADIFFNNCFKNGILPIVLPKEQVEELIDFAKQPDNNFTVDLDNQIVRASNKEYAFDVDPFRKHCLQQGLDDIGLTLEKSQHIDEYETKRRDQAPWLFQNAG
ncbi:MAG: 3-isopropylmalate dehydratase small subunit [Rickettsiales bacterium]|nr:3-isopropylmalate dehydratase small subunit [Rickettsiales bacterium]